MMTDKQPQSATFLHWKRPSPPHLIRGEGEMAQLVRSFDWGITSLGPIESWSESFLAVVNVMLSSPIPTALYWGADRVLLYNDGFLPFTAHRHPSSLGAAGAAVWKEAWHVLSPQTDAVFAGEIIYHENFFLPIEKNGSLQDEYWSYSYSPVYDRGEIAGIFNVCQNTTEKVAAERALRNSESRALRVLESIGDAVIVTDAEGCITHMNRVAEQLTGWTMENALGDRLADVFHIVEESSHQEIESPADKVRRLGTLVGLANHTILIRRDGTEVHIDDSGAPIRNDRGELIGIVLVFRNIDERKQMEREREQAAARDQEVAVRKDLLLKLLQGQRDTTDPNAMLLATAETVGQHLQVDRTGFFDMVDESTAHFTAGWTNGALPSRSGYFSTAGLGSAYLAEILAGKIGNIADTLTDPLTKDSIFAELGVRSVIAVPMLRHGKWRGGFYVHSTRVREWTDAEVAFVREVTNQTLESVELALTQHAVRHSEALSRNILESIGDAVIVKDTKGNITRMNPVAEELTGWKLEDTHGRKLGEVFHIVEESTHQPVENPADRVRRVGAVVRFDTHTILIRRDGREIHIDGSGGPIRDERGELIGIVLVFRDIERRRRMEHELARAATRDREVAAGQELLIKLLHDHRETSDTNVMLLAAAEVVGRHLNVDRAGFFEMPDESTIHFTAGWSAGLLPLRTEDLPAAALGSGHLAEIRAGRSPVIVDTLTDPLTQDSVLPMDGVRSTIGVSMLRHGKWHGGFSADSATLREWTETEIAFAREVVCQTLESVELALAQQAVRRSEARLAKILESIGDAVIVTDADRTITGMNPVAEQLTGWSEDKARGLALAEVVHLVDEQTGETIESAIDSLARPGAIKEIVAQILLVSRGGAKIHIDQSGSPIREDDGRISGMVLIFRDITNRNTTERRLRQAYKMEALGQLTGGIAHDFNNILAIIMGNLELIAEAAGTDTFTRERIEQTVASAERAADLTRRLLAYARQQPLDPVVVDVVSLVHAAAEFIRRSLGPTIVLQVTIADSLWSARIDRNQFENALLNLAVNARDAMPNGGQLKIACKNTIVREGAHDTDGEMAPGAYLLISVTDTGMGMSPDALIRATEPFFTTKPIGKGTGLGLSMVYGFLKQSGGHMQIESQLTVGTKVTMYLPRAVSVQRQTAPARERRLPEPLPRGDEFVLIVEDELAIRRTIAYLLNSLGYRVLEAEDGPTAMLLLMDTPSVDLLLTDVILPNGISGPGLANEAKLIQPAIKVIFSSGYTSNVLTRDYSLDESIHLLNKPFHLADLARMVRSVLDLGKGNGNGNLDTSAPHADIR